jgi:sulfonate transport system permease protein
MTIDLQFERRRAKHGWRLRDAFARSASLAKVATSWSPRVVAVLYGFSLPVAILGAWSLAVRADLLAPQILPPPGLVLDTFMDLLRSGDLEHELGVSLARLFAGLIAGGVLGLGLGLLFGLSRTAETYLAPTIRAIFLVPSLGWLPFFMLIFGIGEGLKFVLIAKTCALPLMVNVGSAIRTLPAKYDDVARCLELDRRARLRFVVFPAVVPAISIGLRQALARGWKALILVEMISSAAGVGYLMMWGRKSFQLDVVFATMIVVAVVGFLFDRIMLALQRGTAGWSLHTAA